MELIKITDKTFYIKNPTNIGVYKVDEKSAILIDSGNDKDAGKKILKILDAEGLKVKGIISTHSNADHIGGNKVIQDRTGCFIYSEGIEKSIVENPLIEPAFLYGSKPFKELENKFLMAKESFVNAAKADLPEGIEIIPLKGHFFDQIGVKTDDDVYFLADALFSEETIAKYHLFFIYDVKAYLDTLDYIEGLNGRFFIASHCEATDNAAELVRVNREKVLEIISNIEEICAEGKSFEEILKDVFDKYQLAMNINQYVLIGSSVKAYLSYLKDSGRITYKFEENRMIWYKL